MKKLPKYFANIKKNQLKWFSIISQQVDAQMDRQTEMHTKTPLIEMTDIQKAVISDKLLFNFFISKTETFLQKRKGILCDLKHSLNTRAL